MERSKDTENEEEMKWKAESRKENFDRSENERIAHLVNTIFDIILEDWLYDKMKKYSNQDYHLLLTKISDLIIKQYPLTFLLPGFPAKSSNKRSKVFGIEPDFAEYFAIQNLITTLRKMEAVYANGVKLIILSDYHTFDQFVNVKHEDYIAYRKELLRLINDSGADDVIQLLSLNDFPEFKDVPCCEASRSLFERYGDQLLLNDFDGTLKSNPALFEKYLGLKRFMLDDLAEILPGSRNSKETKIFIKNVAYGMLQQGISFDKFLEQQSLIKDYIRLSIHDHKPTTGKNTIDLYKNSACCSGILRTPWHHCVVFDTLADEFFVLHKEDIERLVVDGTSLITVKHKGRNWLFIRLYRKNTYENQHDDTVFEMKMIKDGCGVILSHNVTGDAMFSLNNDCLRPVSLTNLIKQFGVVILRGFDLFKDEESFINFYKRRATNGIIPWSFGVLKKVMPDISVPGFVNSRESLPIHFDFSNPPTYMKIKQSEFRFEDYVCREFILYCRQCPEKSKEGATTFVDAHGVTQALHGATKNKWKKIMIAYETVLNDSSGKEPYFGGFRNSYQYPLVHVCPWTGKDVLRWSQSWTSDDNPRSSQNVFSTLQPSHPEFETQSWEELESQIKAICFDQRFFFKHFYQLGDQVYINNYTMLHGRENFFSNRELWRLQAIPPSKNTPEYFLENS